LAESRKVSNFAAAKVIIALAFANNTLKKSSLASEIGSCCFLFYVCVDQTEQDDTWCER